MLLYTTICDFTELQYRGRLDDATMGYSIQ